MFLEGPHASEGPHSLSFIVSHIHSLLVLWKGFYRYSWLSVGTKIDFQVLLLGASLHYSSEALSFFLLFFTPPLGSLYPMPPYLNSSC